MYLSTMAWGATMYAMSPITFMRNPLLLLQTIERFGCTHLGGPNFNYRLLYKRWRSSNKSFDLSTIKMTNIAAEPINSDTIQEIVDIGFPRESVNQTYGAAESLAHIISGGAGFDGKFAACGRTDTIRKFGKHVKVVDDDNFETSDVGRIFVSGPDIAVGYHNEPSLTADTFQNRVCGDSSLQRDWLDTGDLGYIKEDQLYVTGRRKQLIIINGQNLYPYQISQAIEQQFQGVVRAGCCAAFQWGDASIGLVLELYPDQTVSKEDLIRTAKLKVAKLVALPKNGILKTSSGKLRLNEIAARTKEGNSAWPDALWFWESGEAAQDDKLAAENQVSSGGATLTWDRGCDEVKSKASAAAIIGGKQEVLEAISNILVKEFMIDQAGIHPAGKLSESGVDSMQHIEFVQHLEGQLGIRCDKIMAGGPDGLTIDEIAETAWGEYSNQSSSAAWVAAVPDHYHELVKLKAEIRTSIPDFDLEREAHVLKQESLDRDGVHVLTQKGTFLTCASNQYTSLTRHPKIQQAAKDAIDCYGTGIMGPR